jgi:hypothetical protein
VELKDLSADAISYRQHDMFNVELNHSVDLEALQTKDPIGYIQIFPEAASNKMLYKIRRAEYNS